ncbi:DUF4383 domain-containing protein [Rubrobacter marinus]|uniref:DUF4383 domain-containing protein n=1 Tax=Rubrobacter marinus TaxID=2653852 RepID=A0A6G8PW16_9ACTN|nr:DUF4383 domain-containing protein [Rubrobacter marinus]QIN78411.1 DUF4383 domain-containing protein [Rubrobacter marinus]
MSETARTFSLVVGIAFVLLGLLGFVPGITTDEGLLFGFMGVDALHNAIHLVVGALGVAAYYYAGWARRHCRGLGVLFLLIGTLEFAPQLSGRRGGRISPSH